jgi:phage baseplate assembly protein V
MSTIERGTITASKNDDQLRELQVQLQDNYVQDELEHLEPYGFSSEPHCDKETDAMVAFLGNQRGHGIVLSVTDRRYRITQMKTGEVCIYDDKKRHVYLKEDGIEIDGADSPITVKTTDSVKVTAGKTVIIKASQDINLNSASNINITSSGNISITAGGQLTLKGAGVNLE